MPIRIDPVTGPLRPTLTDTTIANSLTLALAVQIDGQPQAALASGLLEFSIERRLNQPACCSVLFNNWGAGPTALNPDYLYFDRKLLDFGKQFNLLLGKTPLFSGRIVALEGNFPAGGVPGIRVVAMDALQRLQERTGFHSHADISDADLVAAVAARHGLAHHIELSGPTHRLLAQTGQSDLEFLRARLEAIDAHLWIDDSGSLRAAHLPGGNEPVVELLLGHNLKEFHVRADLRHLPTTLHSNGWDARAKVVLSNTANTSSIAAELTGGLSGAAVRADTLGNLDDSLGFGFPDSAEENGQTVRAEYRRRARAFIQGTGSTEMEPSFRPGGGVVLSGLGVLFNGAYRITAITHRFDQNQGRRTELEVARPGLGH